MQSILVRYDEIPRSARPVQRGPTPDRLRRRIAEQRTRIRYLEDLSNTDESTGLLNRRGFGVELDRALYRGKRLRLVEAG